MLRPIELSDLDDLVALGSDPDVTRFVGNLDHPSAEERICVAQREWSQRGYGMMAILERDGRRFLGRGGLKYWTRFGETEVGWVLRRDAWGHGYATEAGRACVEWGFANFTLPYLTAMIDTTFGTSEFSSGSMAAYYISTSGVSAGQIVIQSLVPGAQPFTVQTSSSAGWGADYSKGVSSDPNTQAAGWSCRNEAGQRGLTGP